MPARLARLVTCEFAAVGRPSRRFMTTAHARVVWPGKEPLLSAAQIANSTELVGDDSRLACLRAKLRRGEGLAMAAIGGSVTAGSSYRTMKGSEKELGYLYHRKILAALRLLHPSNHSMLNGGVPGTGPTYMEHCVKQHLPRGHVDLVLVEYAVNTDRRPHAYERMLRALLTDPRAPAVIVVNDHRWRAIRPWDGNPCKCWSNGKRSSAGKIDMRRNRTQWAAQSYGEDGRFRDPRCSLQSDEDAIAALCRHYRIPLVSMRAATYDAVRKGDLTLPDFMLDCKHPGANGHSILAEVVLRRLLTAPDEADSHAACAAGAATPASARAAASPSRTLPSPLYGAAGRQACRPPPRHAALPVPATPFLILGCGDYLRSGRAPLPPGVLGARLWAVGRGPRARQARVPGQ